MRFYRSFGLLATVGALSACTGFANQNAQPQSASLTRNLTLIGADGNRYGSVELDPVNGGHMYDSQGRLIGTIVAPPAGTAPAPVAIAPLPGPAN